MELDELKDKWNILSDEVAKQKLLTQNILDKAVKDKVKTMVSDYKYLSIIFYPLFFILLLFIISIDIPYKVMVIILLLCAMCISIWGTVVMNQLKRFISPTLSLTEREESFLKYKKHSRLCYIIEIFILAPATLVWIILFETHRGFPVLYTIVINILWIALPGYTGFKYYRKKMKEIEDCFKEYKEFMEE